MGVPGHWGLGNSDVQLRWKKSQHCSMASKTQYLQGLARVQDCVSVLVLAWHALPPQP